MASTFSDRVGSMHFEPSTDGRQKLRRIMIGAMILVALLFLLPSTFTYINPGYVGIVIHRAGGGVDPHPLGPGVHTRVPFATGIEEYPVYLKTIVLTKGSNEGSGSNDEINVNSVEGQPVSLDVSLSFELDPVQTPKLYSTFRTDIDQITHGFVKQAVRQSLQEVVGTEPIADIIGPKKAEATTRARALIAQRLAPYGFEVKQFTINELRAPAAVMEAINQKNVMQQQADAGAVRADEEVERADAAGHGRRDAAATAADGREALTLER